MQELCNKDPCMKSTLQKVYILEAELTQHKMKINQLKDTIIDIVKLQNIPTEKIKWYNVFSTYGGNNTMKGGFDATLTRERIDIHGEVQPTTEDDIRQMIEYVNTHPFTEISVYLPASYAHSEGMSPSELKMYDDVGPNNPNYRAEFFYEMGLPTIQFDAILHTPVVLLMEGGSYLPLSEKTNLYVHIAKRNDGTIMNELIVDVDMSGRPSVGGRRYRKRRHVGGETTGPITSWSFSPPPPSTPMASLPGATPSEPPSLRRTDREGDYVGFSPMLARRELDSARRLDFGVQQDHPPGCVPISKRLPSHRRDQCEKSDSADGLDRAICKQPGDSPVRTLDDCGPTRVGGKRRKTRKNKKLKRKTRRNMVS